MANDGVLAAGWLALLAAALAACVAARARGATAHAIRDALHVVAAGVWVLGWPLWRGAAAPVAIVLGAAAAALVLPRLAPRVPAFVRFRASVSADDEGWAGIALYVAACAALTIVGLAARRPFAAGAALLALSLGDGLGGFVGRRFGRLAYRTPLGKQKTLEGSLAVALFAAGGIAIAACRFGAAPPPALVLAAALAAATAEALAPRATDNAAVPLAVLAVLLAASPPG